MARRFKRKLGRVRQRRHGGNLQLKTDNPELNHAAITALRL